MTPRTLLALLLLPAAAGAAELVTLDGKKIQGDVVGITGQELTFKGPAGEEKFLVTALQVVTVGPAPKVEATKKHTTVELTDGSFFRASDIAIKGKMLEFALLTTPPQTLSALLHDEEGRGAVYAVNREAGDAKLEQDFRLRVRQRGKFDSLVYKRTVKNDAGTDVEELDAVPGTFGEGDDSAKKVKFTKEGEREPGDQLMSRVAGLILNQKPQAAPPAVCKVIDTVGNEYVAQAVARTGKGYTVTTVSGVKVDLEAGQVSKLDFAAGSVKYLSDLEPVGLEESGTDPEHYQKDKNLDKRPIRLATDPAAGKTDTYPKGLTLKAKTVITYELKGQYKTFRALAGVDADPENVAPSQVRVTIDDGNVALFKGVIKKGDKPIDLNLSVQGVDRLKITVESDGSVTDLGNQVSFANVRVLK